MAPTAFAVTVLLVLTAAATLGGKLPTTRLLPAPPRLALNVGPDPPGLSFPAVTDEFVAQALGRDAGEFLPGPSPTAAVTPAPPAPPGGGVPDPRTSPAPSPAPSPTTLPPAFQFSELTVAMRADREKVPPGGTITYQAIVTNVGNQDFRGAYQLTAHIPFGTVDATSPCDGPLGIDPEHNCVNPPFPTPGSPDPSVHQLSFSFNGTIGQGARQVTVFNVRVNETTQPGTRLQNHTHMDIVGDDRPALTSDPVVVVVRR